MAAMLSISFCHFFDLFNYDIIPVGFLIKSTKKRSVISLYSDSVFRMISKNMYKTIFLLRILDKNTTVPIGDIKK
jgi:hypothetical protein